jgi:hypothetical protein
MLRRFVQRRPLVSYVVLATVLCTLATLWQLVLSIREPSVLRMVPDYLKWQVQNHVYTNAVTIGRFAFEQHPEAFLIFLFSGAPTLAAILVCATGWGRDGLARLFARFKPWGAAQDRDRALRAYGVLLAGYALGIGVHLFLVNARGPAASSQALGNLGGSWLLLPVFALVGAFIDEGGAFEELGWRGFMLPVLQEKLGSPLKATLVLSLVWWAWHIPRDIPDLLTGARGVSDYFVGQIAFITLILAIAILTTNFVNMTGGSVLPAIMIHGGTNLWSKALDTGVVHQGVWLGDPRTLLTYAFAAITLIVAGPRLSYDRDATVRRLNPVAAE